MINGFDNGGGSMQVGSVKVQTTNNRGLSVDEWTERMLEKVIYIAEGSDSLIYQQAVEYKDKVREIMRVYLALAIRSDRTTLYNLFTQQGHKDMAEILRRL